jgi:hypothetical protein
MRSLGEAWEAVKKSTASARVQEKGGVERVPMERYNNGERRQTAMTTTVTGVVANGVVIPSSALPEGAQVEIRLKVNRPEVPPELQEEFDAWERAGAGSIEMVERLAEEIEANEKR